MKPQTKSVAIREPKPLTLREKAIKEISSALSLMAKGVYLF